MIKILGLSASEPAFTNDERRRHREARSAWLRLVAFLILVVNLTVAKQHDSILVHANVVAGYGVATFLALGFAFARRSPVWLATAFVVIDALLVIVLFHEHLFAPDGTLDHNLTAPSLAVGFLLLTHVALRLQPSLVLLFSGLVVLGWLSLLALAVGSHGHGSWLAADGWSVFATEGALAAAFGFAAFVCYLLTRDHDVLLQRAVTSERRRRNLARFFSPNVLSELQTTGASLALTRRRAAVMFVDLRSFTRFSETVSPEEVADLLAEYRELVTQAVFAHGGTIDKFIGDGVMAAFGQPHTAPDDTARALRCALELAGSLERWKEARLRHGKTGLDAGIGLHVGIVIGGVLQSGSHDEFTLFGDAVNIAGRLERLSRPLEASIVVSDTVMSEAQNTDARWVWQDSVALDGRRGRLRIAYLPRGARDPSGVTASPPGS